MRDDMRDDMVRGFWNCVTLPSRVEHHMIRGFKAFLLRGNVVDLAVAIVIGIAFGAVIKAFTTGIIGGILGAIGGSPNFDGAGFTINKSLININRIVTKLINFVIVATAIFFLIVLPINKLNERRKRGEEPEAEAPSEDILLLQEIRDLLRQRSA